MRVAVLISGEPRFCTDFDKLMSSFKNYSSIDYFFYLWDKSPRDFSDQRWNLVADKWRDIDIDWAKEKLKQNINLPDHNFVELELGNIDTELLTIPTVTKKASETNVRNVWLMHRAWNHVNNLKNMKQAKDNFKYDLVINGRLDITVDDLDLSQIHEYLIKNGASVLTVHKPLFGYKERKIKGKLKTVPAPLLNDTFTMGLEPSMDTFMTVGNHTLDGLSQGALFHPETLLYFYLRTKGIQIVRYKFNMILRNGWKPGDPFYTSNFAHWA